MVTRTHDTPDASGRYPHQYVAGFFRKGRVVELPQPAQWDCLGYKPRPITRWQRFRSHLGHGLLMQYPLRSVLGFSIRGLFWRMDRVVDMRKAGR